MQVNPFIGRSLLIVVLLCSHFCTLAQNHDQHLWQQAGRYYTQGKFDSAQKIYLEILAHAGDQPELFYNLGNTAYRLQQTDSAILFYEKSLHLDPHNLKTRQNLALAQNRVINPLPNAPVFFFTKWWNSLLTAFSPNTWAWMALGIFLILMGMIYLIKSKQQRLPYFGRWLSLTIVCLLLSLCLAYFSFDYATDSGRAVVMDQDRSLFAEPLGKVILEIPEGTVVLIIGEQDGYMRLRLPNGNEGWMKQGSITKI